MMLSVGSYFHFANVAISMFIAKYANLDVVILILIA